MKQNTVHGFLKATISLTVTSFLLMSVAEAGPRIMKMDQNGKTGQCTGPLNGSVDEVLNRNGVRVSKSATGTQKLALAKGIQQLERLSGGPFPAAKGAMFNFLNNQSGYSNQTGSGINMRGGPGKTANTAYLMHELGHRVGNSGYYSKYKAAVKSPCNVTHYCSIHYSKARYRNEEFGEVFAAFVTHPELLKQGNAACKQAYNWFQNNVFKNGPQLASCGAATQLVAQGKDPLVNVRSLASPEAPLPVATNGLRASCAAVSPAVAPKGLTQLADYLDDQVHAAN